jgi:heme/copper-type cytochrome/quinol oxidase subunit 3
LGDEAHVMSGHRIKMRLSTATWLFVTSPVLLFLAFITLAMHARVGLGHWPTPMVENYDSPAYRTHELVFTLIALFTLFVAVPSWLLMLCFRPFRISLRTHVVQAGVYVAGWLLIVLYGAIDPGRFMEWFLD